MPPNNVGGRPKKYSSAEAARLAHIEGKRRRRAQQRLPQRPVDFIMYEPQLHHDIPIETRPEIGIRTSSDIQIPPDPYIAPSPYASTQQGEIRPVLLLKPQQSTEAELPETEEEADIYRQVESIRTEEEEAIAEQAEYEGSIAEAMLRTRITEQEEHTTEQTKSASGVELDTPRTVDEVRGPLGINTLGLQSVIGADQDVACDDQSRLSYTLDFGGREELILTG